MFLRNAVYVVQNGNVLLGVAFNDFTHSFPNCCTTIERQKTALQFVSIVHAVITSSLPSGVSYMYFSHVRCNSQNAACNDIAFSYLR